MLADCVSGVPKQIQLANALSELNLTRHVFFGIAETTY